jgi:hypothetical protein
LAACEASIRYQNTQATYIKETRPSVDAKHTLLVVPCDLPPDNPIFKLCQFANRIRTNDAPKLRAAHRYRADLLYDFLGRNSKINVGLELLELWKVRQCI